MFFYCGHDLYKTHIPRGNKSYSLLCVYLSFSRLCLVFHTNQLFRTPQSHKIDINLR